MAEGGREPGAAAEGVVLMNWIVIYTMDCATTYMKNPMHWIPTQRARDWYRTLVPD